MENEFWTEVIESVVPYHKHLGIQVVSLGQGHSTLKLPYQKHFIGDTQRPALHGGVISTMLDAAGGAAAMSLMSQEDRISTIDLRVDYLLPAEIKDLFVEAKVIREGNRVIATSMKAYHEDSEQIVAEGRGVYNLRRSQ